MTLRAHDVSVRFGGIQALEGVTVEVAPGEVAAVVGSNGSGKSTLFNAIMGFAPLARGAIDLDGAPIHGLAPHRRVQRGLCRTFQTPRIDAESTVFDAVRSGGVVSLKTGLAAACLATPRGRAEAAAIDARVGKVLEALNLSHFARVEMGELPMGTVRLVDVGRAMMGSPRFILLDEPAAGLSYVEQEALKAQIRRLAAEGVGVLLVEHNFRFVADLSDHITVLERGRVLDQGRPDEVSRRPEFIRIYLGSHGETQPDGRAAGAASSPHAAPEPVCATAARPLMECRGVSARHGRIQVCFDIDLDVPAAGVVAVMGANGAGKSSLLGAIGGLVQSGGRIALDGEDIATLPAHRRSEKGVCLVPEIRGNVFPTMSVAENLKVVWHHLSAAALHEMRDSITAMFPRLQERMASEARMLSGGEQQMLAIAMALSLKPRVLLLDEPTQGLAPAVYDTLEATIRSITGRGISVILAEQNATFAARVADRAVVLADGRVSVEADRDILTDRERLMHAYLGSQAKETE